MPQGREADTQPQANVRQGPPGSERTDILGTRPLGTGAFDVGYALALLKVVEGHPFHVGPVKKDIVSVGSPDEAEALVGDAFDRSFSHSIWFFRVNHTGRRAEALLLGIPMCVDAASYASFSPFAIDSGKWRRPLTLGGYSGAFLRSFPGGHHRRVAQGATSVTR